MRILHIGNGNEKHRGLRYYDVGRKLQHGFIRNHYNSLFFSDRDITRKYGPFGAKWCGKVAANNRLLAFVKNFRPDMIFLGHADIITNATLAEIRDTYSNIRIAQFNVDPVFRSENDRAIKARLPFVDATFITTGGDVLKRYSGNGAIASYIPNPTDSAIECYQAFAHEETYDLFYAVRAATMKHASVNNRIVFPCYIEQHYPTLRTSFHGFDRRKELYGIAFYQRMSQCAMGLNLSHNHTTKGTLYYATEEEKCYYSSDRISQYMGNGLLTFTQRGFNQEALFNEKEIVFFDTKEELADKVQYYALNKTKRKQIAQAGWEKYHQCFNADIVARYIVETTMSNKTGSFDWDTNIYI